MKRWLYLLPVAALAALVVVGVSQLTRDNPAPSTFASPIRPAPQIVAPALDGEDVDFGALGGPVLVNFWATWCTPCKAEHPLLVDMAQQGATIVGILHKDRPDLARQLLAKDGDPFARVALDPIGDVSLAFGISGVPETFLVDASGTIIKSFRGPLDANRARDFLDAWRAEAAKAGG